MFDATATSRGAVEASPLVSVWSGTKRAAEAGCFLLGLISVSDLFCCEAGGYSTKQKRKKERPVDRSTAEGLTCLL